FWIGIAAAAMTAFYSWRLLILTFHGRTRADKHTYEHAHESPPVMIAPLLMLTAGEIFSGWLAFDHFVGAGMDEFWRGSILMLHNVIEEAHHGPGWVPLLHTLVGVPGIAAAFVMYLLRP